MQGVRAGTRSFATMQVLRILSSFAVASLISRQLGTDGKGTLALVQQLPSIMALVMGFGFAGVNVYYVGSGRRTAAQAFTDSLLISLVATVIGVPLSFVLMQALPALDGLSFALVALSALVVPLGVFSSQLAGILVGQGRPEWQARAQSVAVIAQLAIVGVLYLLVRLSIAAVVAANVVGSVLAISIMFIALGERGLVAGAMNRVREAASYAKRRYFTDIAAMLEMRVDIVMLGILSTASAVGVYSVAVALVELLWFIPRAAETPLLSRFLKEHAEKGVELVARAVRLTVLLEIIMLATAALLLKPAVALVFGPGFSGAPALFWMLAPGVVMNGLVGPIVSYLTSRGHQFPWLSGASVLGNIALNAALIPIIGVAGAAIASSVTYALGSVWLVWRFRRETRCTLGALFVPRAEDLRVLTGRSR